jgi:DNA adenine methylase
LNLPPLVPPLKCQGIKTKLAGEIGRLAHISGFDRWIEPFCGSCVVPLNVQPKRAFLSDSNVHIVRLFEEIRSGNLTAGTAKTFLTEEGEKLLTRGEPYYYEVRDRFNAKPTSLDFLFLNRSCFNGVMRFNRLGKFNVPYGHKPKRFAQAYVTKICNQIRRFAEITSSVDWVWEAADFRSALAKATASDLVYVDPPYAGRHTDYFNCWSEADEEELAALLKALPCRFILSTWHSNEFRTNEIIARNWQADSRYHMFTRKHFYHVGSSEDLRHPMIEALITNFPAPAPITVEHNQLAFLEEPVLEYAERLHF